MQGEGGFLEICRNILETSKIRDDRTGIGTFSIFSPRVISYDLTNGRVPCFTTRKIAWKSTIKELLWFISGSTTSTLLEKQGVDWWTGNTSREYLDSHGLQHFNRGELGKMYGWQWRHLGEHYIAEQDRPTDWIPKGIDQLANLINEIKTNPNSRRLLIVNYNPQDLGQAVLPACHALFQFYVDRGFLSCNLYQRSADMFLGAQINILSYSILTHMIAKICGLQAKTFYHHIGDAHIYDNHVDQMWQQLSRPIKPSPSLIINGDQQSIDDFTIDDFNLIDYNHAPSIQAKMAI